MIKSIVEKIMVKEFSKYIDGIEYKKLTIQIMDGYFSIQNIALNHQFFNGLETPFTVIYSHIGKLSIEASITKLSSVPVQCTIEDVYLIAQHKTCLQFTRDTPKDVLLRKFVKQTYQNLLNKIQEHQKEKGMIDKMAKKVLDNLRINIKNIHLRFEEDNDNHTYSFGVALKELSFINTDRNSRPVFIETQKNKDEPIYKFIAIEKFKIYWESIRSDRKDQCLFLREWETKKRIMKMRDFVMSDTDSIFNINSRVLMTLNPTNAFTLPLFHMQVYLQPININFSKQKVVEVLDFTTSCIHYNEHMLKTLLDKALTKTNYETEKQYRHICSEYVDYLLEKKKDKEKDKNRKPRVMPEHFHQMLEHMSIESLQEWTTPAIKQKVQRQKEKQLRKDKKGFFESSSEVELTHEEIRQIERLIDDLMEEGVGKGRPSDSLLLRLVLEVEGVSFTFYDEDPANRLRQISLRIDGIQLALSKSIDNSYLAIQPRIRSILADLSVVPVENMRAAPRLIKLLENSTSGSNQYLIEGSYKKSIYVGEQTIVTYLSDVTLRKMVFTYKQEYWRLFNSFFSMPEIDQQVQKEARGRIKQFKDNQGQDKQEEDVEIERHYRLRMHLDSPCIILPLTPSTCWLLDLGTITMNSYSNNDTFTYPFKLAKLNMRFITHSEPHPTYASLTSIHFFPIISDIDLTFTISYNLHSPEVTFDLDLQSVALNATKEEFLNLMKVKSFLTSPQKDEVELQIEQQKARESVESKARMSGRLYRRSQYLQAWMRHYCIYSQSTLYLYNSEQDLMPESMIDLGSVQLQAVRQVYEPYKGFVIELASGTDVVELLWREQNTRDSWLKQIRKNFQQLQQFQAVEASGKDQIQKQKKKKEEDMINLNVKLQSLSWNYITPDGQSFMRIQLTNIDFKAMEEPQKVSTLLQIGSITIWDKVHQYSNPKYQHLLVGSNLAVLIQTPKEQTTKIKSVSASASIAELDVNWKPDSLLVIIDAIGSFAQGTKTEDIRQNIINKTWNSDQMGEKIWKYHQEGQGHTVKDKREQYLAVNVKDEQIHLKVKTEVKTMSFNFIHRKSHMPMFRLHARNFVSQHTLSDPQQHVSYTFGSLVISQMSGYPQQTYDPDATYPPQPILQPHPDNHFEGPHLKVIRTSYLSQFSPNQERTDSFFKIDLAPSQFIHYQEVTLRWIDYVQEQILFLTSHPKSVKANQTILSQLNSNKQLNEGQRVWNFADEELQDAIKRVMHPLFTDYWFTLRQPELVLSPSKTAELYFIVKCDQMLVSNSQHISEKRFTQDRKAYPSQLQIYEETVKIEIGSFHLHTSVPDAPLMEPLSFQMAVDRLLLEDQLHQFDPGLTAYDRSYYISLQLSAMCMPKLHRHVFQTLLQVPTHNIIFEDGHDCIFLHNYSIKKLVPPNPIKLRLIIPIAEFEAGYSLQTKGELMLWGLTAKGFEMQVHRDQKLHTTAEISVHQALAHSWKYLTSQLEQFKGLSTARRVHLGRIKPILSQRNAFAIIKVPKEGAIKVQGVLQNCQLDLDPGIVGLLADWAIPDDNVFPDNKPQDRQVHLLLRMPAATINFKPNPDYCMQMTGEVTVNLTRFKGLSPGFLLHQLTCEAMREGQFSSLDDFMKICLTLSVDVSSNITDNKDCLFQGVILSYQQNSSYRIREKQMVKAQSRSVSMDQLTGKITLRDAILMEKVKNWAIKADKYESIFSKILNGQRHPAVKAHFDDKWILEELSKYHEQLQLRFGPITLHFIHQEQGHQLPALKMLSQRVTASQFVSGRGGTVWKAQAALCLEVFNSEVWAWQPVIEGIQAEIDLTKSDFEVTGLADVGSLQVNLSQQMTVTLQKTIEGMNKIMKAHKQGQVNWVQKKSILSQYFIYNHTGYDIEVKGQKGGTNQLIHNAQCINYSSGQVISSPWCLPQVSITLLHPTLKLRSVHHVPLHHHRNSAVKLFTLEGKALPAGSQLFIQRKVEGWKKVVILRGTKYIKDYSKGCLSSVYYPFDCSQSFVTPQQVRANFYQTLQTKNFIYQGIGGCLTIRKKYIIRNLTSIPLRIHGQLVQPSSLCTSNRPPPTDNILHSYHDQQTNTFYLYSICVLINHCASSLETSFEPNHHDNIVQKYTHRFTKEGRDIVVQLLAHINQDFTVKQSNRSTACTLKGKLARQTFSIEQDNKVKAYACYSHMSSFSQEVKQFQKNIQITEAHIVCNQTEYGINLVQDQTEHELKLEVGQQKTFNWSSMFSPELFRIFIRGGESEWHPSAPLPLQHIQSVAIRNKNDSRQVLVLRLELEQTNNVTFLKIVSDTQSRYQIHNRVSDCQLVVYQTAVSDPMAAEYLPEGIDPQSLTFKVQPEDTCHFAYQLPLHSHQLTLIIRPFEKYTEKFPPVTINIPNLQESFFNEQVIVNDQKGSDHTFLTEIKLHNNRRVLEVKKVKDEMQGPDQKAKVNMRLKVNRIGVSLIGRVDTIRKQLVYAIIGGITAELTEQEDTSHLFLSFQDMRVENTIRPEPYFISLLHQDQKQRRPALMFALKRSRSTPNLVHYFGLSIKSSSICVTSHQLQILEENFNQFLKVTQKKINDNSLELVCQKFKPSISKSFKIYFIEAELRPFRCTLTYKHVNNWGGALLKALSINECHIKVNGKKIHHFESDGVTSLGKNMLSHLKDELGHEVFSMVGSLAVLGSPINLASKIGGGLRSLVELPAQGYEDEGVLGVGKGLAKGAGSLVSNTVEGAFGSVESLTGALAEGVSGLASYDSKFEKKRQDLKNERVDHIGEGLISGGKSIANGLFTGITGLVSQPIKGAQKGGFGGFLKGGLKGLSGLIVKPVSGVIDATSKTAQGIKNTTKVFSEETKQLRTRQHLPRAFYGFSRQIRIYDSEMADWNIKLGEQSQRLQSLGWLGLYSLRNEQILIITTDYVLVVASERGGIINSIDSKDVREAVLDERNSKIYLSGKNNARQFKVMVEPMKSDCKEVLSQLRLLCLETQGYEFQ